MANNQAQFDKNAQPGAPVASFNNEANRFDNPHRKHVIPCLKLIILHAWVHWLPSTKYPIVFEVVVEKVLSAHQRKADKPEYLRINPSVAGKSDERFGEIRASRQNPYVHAQPLRIFARQRRQIGGASSPNEGS
ncbi:hypothetical protein BDQ17DRAFT_1326712 [Cyathus striatus]|nr:hypothetical protein BDQ17DRAFT_1326712 [Cyathus striatus]